MPSVLREHKDFRRYWVGQTGSLFGDQVSLLALPLTAVLVLHAGPAQMGALGAAGLLPNLLFSVPAGALADRLGRRRRLMIAADCGRALLLGSVPLAALLHVLTMTQLLAVAFGAGTLSVLFMVSASSLFVSLVPRERYLDANSTVFGSRAFSFVAGPSAGGLLVQALSAPVALLADAGTFLASALSLASIRPAESAPSSGPGQLAGGLRFLVHSPVMRSSMAATATINFGNFVYQALVILYATPTLGLRPGVLGLVVGCGAVGALLGSMVAGRLARGIGVGPAFLVGCVLFPAPLILVPLAGGPSGVVIATLLVALFLSGLGVMILDIPFGSITAALV
ncbi:MAG: MFS transporter, partial [Actinobacteria bacterium]|nr:MFS transporter [Actinomycetota bacterium]